MALGPLDMHNGAYTGTDEFDIFYSPHFFRDGAHAGAVLKSEIGAQASAKLESQYKARLLGVGRLGSFNLMLKEPISSMADLKGRKIRSAQIRGCIEGPSHVGAIPTPIPFNEIYLALQNGIVEGALTALNPGVQIKFCEVANYVVVPDFGLALDKEVISTAAWNALSRSNCSSTTAIRRAILSPSWCRSTRWTWRPRTAAPGSTVWKSCPSRK